jgi:flagellar basal body P-ring formation protein FlgA
MRGRRAHLLACALVASLGVLGCGGAPAAERMLPVPSVTIQPGQSIRDETITERAFAPNGPGFGNVVETRSQLAGQVARRTLMPGQPIPMNAIDPPGTVVRGVPVRLIVEDNGLVIIAYAAPLQNGSVGATIRLRNLDTGVIVTGIVQSDGTVRAGNG